MKTGTGPVVDAIGKLNFSGNIIPHAWYQNLRPENGRVSAAYFLALGILAEIVYWYRPQIVRDERTGRVLEVRKRFRADKLQRSYDSFAEQFGAGKELVKGAVKFLIDNGLITTEFRNIRSDSDSGVFMANVMYVEPIPDAIERITFCIKEAEDTLCGYEEDTPHGYEQDPHMGMDKTQTYTEITTEISTRTSEHDDDKTPDPTTPAAPTEGENAEWEEACRLYRDLYGIVGERDKDRLEDWRADYGVTVVLGALKVAFDHNKRDPVYAEACMKNWGKPRPSKHPTQKIRVTTDGAIHPPSVAGRRWG